MSHTPFFRFVTTTVLVAYLNLTFSIVPAFAAQPAAPAGRPEPLVRTATDVKVNRVAPASTPVAATPRFSPQPTVAEIFNARVLAEPFVPLIDSPPAAETAHLASAISRYATEGKGDIAVFSEFLSQYPNSAWAPSVRLNRGLKGFMEGRFSDAISDYELAWNATKASLRPAIKSIADRAVAELLRMHARLGRVDTLERIFAEIAGRQFTGTATELVAGARDGLALMKARPDAAYRCGPAALDRLLARQNGNVGFNKVLTESRSTASGVNLSDVLKLAGQVGLKMQMAKRSQGAAILAPAVVHWKLGHYAAMFAEGDGFRLEDPTFGPSAMRATRATIDQEASGYFLVPAGSLPAGWEPVSDQEGQRVWGKGNTTGGETGRTGKDEPKAGPDGDPSGCGMTVADAHLMLVSLNLVDTPIGYTPPLGPSIQFTATYNQREASQPTTIDYSNLGSKWLHNWLSFVDEGAIPATGTAILSATLRLPGGGSDSYSTSSMSVDPLVYPYAFVPQPRTRTRLEKTNAQTFVVTEANGASMTFGRRTGAAGSYRYFLTALTDATGQSASLTYDAQNRLTSIVDALGQVTTLSYEVSGEPLKISKVTDPFGRFATFQYDASGRLEKITDVIGLLSQFAYSGTSDFIQSLTTPYGTSTFAFGVSGLDRWLELTDATGATRRVEYRNDWSGLPGSGTLPAGMNVTSLYQNFRNTLYWDKRAWGMAPGDPNAAKISHWLHTALNETSGTLENEKTALEGRIFYNYEGQTNAQFEGTSSRPTAVGRVLDDGTTQLSTFEYNSFGRVTKATDPLGRVTTFIYATNDIDLLETRQKTGPNTADYEVLGKATYNAQHLPLTVTDASGRVTTMTYNSAGQVSTVTNAKSEVTSYFYDPAGNPAGSRLPNGDRDPAATGYLVAVDGPLAGTSDTTTFAYDGYGRLRTTTDSEGFAVTVDFDLFDRPTVTTFPDATFTQAVYDKLDLIKRRDRRGQWSFFQYNKLRQMITSKDPLGRLTQFDWCSCGVLNSLIDPLGQTTVWNYDIQARVLSKEYHDGKTIRFAYEDQISRRKTVTDAKSQVKSYQYFKDGALKQVSYSGGSVVTPTVSYTYETYYRRLATMTDGVGVTTYGYNSIPQTNPPLGSGRLASIDGPFANDTITYSYDELGRTIGQSINGAANSSSVVFDVLGRTSSLTNVLGTFTYAYVNSTGRIDHVDYPNGQRTNYTYFPNSGSPVGNGDQRLQQIQNLKSGSVNLSTFGYTYDADGLIKTWSRQIDGGSALTSTFKYDQADQLTEAAVPVSASVTKNYVYRYSRAGNRVSEQIDNAVFSATHNGVNQITALAPSGPIRFEGTVNEPSIVTVGGQPASVDGAGNFAADLALSPGTQTVAVTATDGTSNAATKSYQVVVASGSSRTLSHDLNGNLINDGAGRTYDWDAEDRLIKITQGANVTEFVYDGEGRRVREKLNSFVIKQWVWTGGPQPSEERDGSNSVARRFFRGLGQQVGASSYFYATDHLGSVREMVDSSGTIRARYEYDPYGRISKVSGDLESDFGFTGLYRHQSSTLNLALYRAYDADLGRWLSRDPIEELDGTNLYAYLANNPINSVDLHGLCDKRGWGRRFVDWLFGNRGDEKYEINSIGRLNDRELNAEFGITGNDNIFANAGGELVEDAAKAAAARAAAAAAAAAAKKIADAAKKAADAERTAADIISKDLKGSVNKEFPGQWRDKTLRDITEAASNGDKSAQTAKKLLTDNRFKK